MNIKIFEYSVGINLKILDSQTFGHLIHLQLRKVIKAKVKHNILHYMNAILLENFPKNSYLIHVCYNRVLYAFNNEKKVKKGFLLIYPNF